MATPGQINDALKSLDDGGGLDIKGLTKEAIKKKLEGSFPDDPERVKEIVDSICKDESNYLYKSIEQKVKSIDNSIKTLPRLASSLVAQHSIIPASVTGPAAPAAAPMILGVKSQATALKTQLAEVLSTASELEISLPVDPLISIIPMIKPLLL